MRRIHIMSKNVRRGMTLIEILVVIAIIAILASLLLVGVMPLLRKGPEVKVRNEISQFAVAMDKFHTKYGTYPPSTLKLCSRRSDYGNAAIDQRSIAIITAMFPQLGGTAAPWVAVNWGNRQGPAPNLPPNGTTINYTDILAGDQCLVFFLGGIPNGAGKTPLGFSTNPATPAATGGDRKKEFDFEASRVQFRNGTIFPSYLDPFIKQQPYVFFSSMTLSSGDNRYDPMPINIAATQFAPVHTVSPYVQDTTGGVVKYWNPTKFQIISAGADGTFGSGGTTQLTPMLVQQPWPANSPTACKDDWTNFNSSKLGAPD